MLALRYLKRRALPQNRILTHQGGLIAADTGQKVDRIFEDSLHDHWYSAQEALDYGFVDLIVSDFSVTRPQQRRSAVTGFGGPPAREEDR